MFQHCISGHSLCARNDYDTPIFRFVFLGCHFMCPPLPLCAVRKRVSKHRVSALGLFLGSLVLNDIPVLKQDSVFHADNIRRNPVDRQPEAREAAVDDDKVSLRATITPGSYLRVGGKLLMKLKRPARPGSMCALC